MYEQGQISIVLVCLVIALPFSQCQNNTTTSAMVTESSTATPTTSSMNLTTTMFGNATTVTETTTTAATTTTTPPPPPKLDLNHNTDTAVYVLELSVSLGNSSDIQYFVANVSREDLERKLVNYFSNFSFGGRLVTDNNAIQATRPFILEIEFLYKNIYNNTSQLQNQIRVALQQINMTGEYMVSNIGMTLMAVAEFLNSTMDACKAEDICPLGFTCFDKGCEHMCSKVDCSGHGRCYTSVSPNLTVMTMCQCDSEYAIEYTGENCEYSRRGRLQIIAIIAGVLGAACLVFIIIIIVMCVKCGRNSSSNYEVSGGRYPNNAYDNSQNK